MQVNVCVHLFMMGVFLCVVHTVALLLIHMSNTIESRSANMKI